MTWARNITWPENQTIDHKICLPQRLANIPQLKDLENCGFIHFIPEKLPRERPEPTYPINRAARRKRRD